MKSKIQKENIREMLYAEKLGDAKSPWGDFKRKLSDEFLSTKVPALEITAHAPLPTSPRLRGEVPDRAVGGVQRFVFFRWLAPAFAVFLVVVGIFLWRMNPGTQANTVIAGSGSPPTAHEFRKGDVFQSERREIRFLKGSAAVTQEAQKIRIETTVLTADFRLKQKVDMQIRHPLITVTITGTQFLFDVAANGGSIRLSEGSLVIEHHAIPEKKVLLNAPSEFTFTAGKHAVTPLKVTSLPREQILYRYDLVNGETFFAHQLKVDAKIHRVHLLGGSDQVIPVENIVRVVAAENP